MLAAFEFCCIVHENNSSIAYLQLPQNFRNILTLSKEILRCAERMKNIYEEKKDIFDRTPDLQESLYELYQYVSIVMSSCNIRSYKVCREMRLVHNRCKRLIPPSTEKRRDKFKLAFYSFLNRDKVATLVVELKDHIDGLYKQFVVS